MTITALLVAVAFLVGGIEALGLIADKFNFRGGIWDIVVALNGNFGVLGFLIVGIFVLCWAVSAAIYRMRRYDEIEIRT